LSQPGPSTQASVILQKYHLKWRLGIRTELHNL